MLKRKGDGKVKPASTLETLSRENVNPLNVKEAPRLLLLSRYNENLRRLAFAVDREFIKRFGADLKQRILNHNHPIDVIGNLSKYLMLRDHPEEVRAALEESINMRDMMINEIRHRVRGEILDAGCGNGVMTASIGAELGVEIDETAIALAKTAFPSLRCLHDDLETMQLKRLFNTITMIVALHEIKHKRKAVLNLKRHLSPEGNMLIVELDENIPWVKSLLKAAGMEVTEQRELGRWFVHSHFHNMYLIEAELRKRARVVL